MIDCWNHTARRWHASPWPALRNSGDDTAAHSNRMAKLALWLWGADVSRDLLAAIVLHDSSESGPGGTGDVPGPSKVGTFGGALTVRTAKIERERGTCRWLWHLTADDQRRLRFVDVLDALRWVSMCEPRALAGDGWPEAREWLLAEAEHLGVLTQVEGLLTASQRPADAA